MSYSLDFPYAHGGPLLKGLYKQSPVDFSVRENLGFTPTGNGEHVFVLVEKTALNTLDAQAILARHCGISRRDTGFAGMKDKQAVSQQSFSLTGGQKTLARMQTFEHPQITVLDLNLNSKKLKRGAHRGNAFSICVRQIQSNSEMIESQSGYDEAVIKERIGVIAAEGVPNYFGPQRFGFRMNNLESAERWFEGTIRADRNQRSLWLSAARSYIFNSVLADRVSAGTWNTYLPGDVMNLAGTASTFKSIIPGQDTDLAILARRLKEKDIHPTGPLWGNGDLASAEQTLELERHVAKQFALFCKGLKEAGLEHERKPLRLIPDQFSCEFNSENSFTLEFTLPKGAFATSILREIITVTERPLTLMDTVEK